MSKTRAATGVALMAALAMAVSGCHNFLDVNKDPNNPVSVRMSLTLPSIEVVFMDQLLAGDYAQWGDEWTQQWSYNHGADRPYSQFQYYEMTSIDTQGIWDNAYVDVGQECQNMMKQTAADGDPAYHGIAEFILAWTGTIMTEAFGPIPWSEAWDTQNPTPKYDSQKSVYQSALKMMDQAIADMQKTGGEMPGDNDLLFAGDMSKWVQLAKSVEARIEIHMVDATGESAQAHAQAALADLQGGVTADADFTFPGGDGGRQPLYATFDTAYNSWSGRYVASSTMMSLLDSLNDPRKPIMFTKALADGQYHGLWDGSGGVDDSTVSKIGPAFTVGDRPFEWFTVAENDFIEAEARLITSGAAAADAPYRAGIRANMQAEGVAASDIDAYIAARPPLNSSDALERIITQKYIASFLHTGAWTDWRRTGYPKLNYVPTAPDIAYTFHNIPERLRTPANEIENNAQAVAATGIDQGMAGMEVKLWFAGGK